MCVFFVNLPVDIFLIMTLSLETKCIRCLFFFFVVVVFLANNAFNPYRPASLLWDIGNQNSPRCDAAKRGVRFGAILFVYMIFIEKR